MADTSLATIEKNLVWQQIEQILGKMNTPSRSKEWRISQDKKVSVFVTFSKIHNSSRTAWYDINVHRLNDWLQYPKAYIIFVVDTHQNTFVIPAIELKKEMDKSKRQPTDLGNIDIHIKKDPEFYISEYQHFDLMNYHSAYHHLSI